MIILQQAIDSYPQLQGQFRETDSPVMNLQDIIARQEAENPTDGTTPPNDDVRCIPKVMQVKQWLLFLCRVKLFGMKTI